MRYRTTILQTGASTTGIPVPPDVLAALGHGRQPRVVVTVGHHTYRSAVATRDGQSMVSLSAENRAAAGVVGGQEVEVDLVVDDAPRTVEVPEDLARALDAHDGARAAFDALAPSRRKAHVVAVESAKAAETRQRRIDKVVAEVRPLAP